MSKVKKIIVLLFLIIVFAFCFAGCNSGTNELQNKIDNLQNQLEEMNDKISEMEQLENKLEEMNGKLSDMEEKIEQLEKKISENVTGKFYSLREAYDNGWLNEDDLKSIACSYNDFQKQDNPYSGMYEPPAEELSKNVENELKQAYLNQIAQYPIGLLENVQINYYYGTYNGNIVVRIYSNYLCMDPMVEEEVYIGNVVFKRYPDVETWVYHID